MLSASLNGTKGHYDTFYGHHRVWYDRARNRKVYNGNESPASYYLRTTMFQSKLALANSEDPDTATPFEKDHLEKHAEVAVKILSLSSDRVIDDGAGKQTVLRRALHLPVDNRQRPEEAEMHSEFRTGASHQCQNRPRREIVPFGFLTEVESRHSFDYECIRTSKLLEKEVKPVKFRPPTPPLHLPPSDVVPPVSANGNCWGWPERVKQYRVNALTRATIPVTVRPLPTYSKKSLSETCKDSAAVEKQIAYLPQKERLSHDSIGLSHQQRSEQLGEFNALHIERDRLRTDLAVKGGSADNLPIAKNNYDNTSSGASVSSCDGGVLTGNSSEDGYQSTSGVSARGGGYDMISPQQLYMWRGLLVEKGEMSAAAAEKLKPEAVRTVLLEMARNDVSVADMFEYDDDASSKSSSEVVSKLKSKQPRSAEDIAGINNLVSDGVWGSPLDIAKQFIYWCTDEIDRENLNAMDAQNVLSHLLKGNNVSRKTEFEAWVDRVGSLSGFSADNKSKDMRCVMPKYEEIVQVIQSAAQGQQLLSQALEQTPNSAERDAAQEAADTQGRLSPTKDQAERKPCLFRKEIRKLAVKSRFGRVQTEYILASTFVNPYTTTSTGGNLDNRLSDSIMNAMQNSLPADRDLADEEQAILVWNTALTLFEDASIFWACWVNDFLAEKWGYSKARLCSIVDDLVPKLSSEETAQLHLWNLQFDSWVANRAENDQERQIIVEEQAKYGPGLLMPILALPFQKAKPLPKPGETMSSKKDNEANAAKVKEANEKLLMWLPVMKDINVHLETPLEDVVKEFIALKGRADLIDELSSRAAIVLVVLSDWMDDFCLWAMESHMSEDLMQLYIMNMPVPDEPGLADRIERNIAGSSLNLIDLQSYLAVPLQEAMYAFIAGKTKSKSADPEWLHPSNATEFIMLNNWLDEFCMWAMETHMTKSDRQSYLKNRAERLIQVQAWSVALEELEPYVTSPIKDVVESFIMDKLGCDKIGFLWTSKQHVHDFIIFNDWMDDFFPWVMGNYMEEADSKRYMVEALGCTQEDLDDAFDPPSDYPLPEGPTSEDALRARVREPMPPKGVCAKPMDEVSEIVQLFDIDKFIASLSDKQLKQIREALKGEAPNAQKLKTILIELNILHSEFLELLGQTQQIKICKMLQDLRSREEKLAKASPDKVTVNGRVSSISVPHPAQESLSSEHIAALMSAKHAKQRQYTSDDVTVALKALSPAQLEAIEQVSLKYFSRMNFQRGRFRARSSQDIFDFFKKILLEHGSMNEALMSKFTDYHSALLTDLIKDNSGKGQDVDKSSSTSETAPPVMALAMPRLVDMPLSVVAVKEMAEDCPASSIKTELQCDQDADPKPVAMMRGGAVDEISDALKAIPRHQLYMIRDYYLEETRSRGIPLLQLTQDDVPDRQSVIIALLENAVCCFADWDPSFAIHMKVRHVLELNRLMMDMSMVEQWNLTEDMDVNICIKAVFSRASMVNPKEQDMLLLPEDDDVEIENSFKNYTMEQLKKIEALFAEPTDRDQMISLMRELLVVHNMLSPEVASKFSMFHVEWISMRIMMMEEHPDLIAAERAIDLLKELDSADDVDAMLQELVPDNDQAQRTCLRGGATEATADWALMAIISLPRDMLYSIRDRYIQYTAEHGIPKVLASQEEFTGEQRLLVNVLKEAVQHISDLNDEIVDLITEDHVFLLIQSYAELMSSVVYDEPSETVVTHTRGRSDVTFQNAGSDDSKTNFDLEPADQLDHAIFDHFFALPFANMKTMNDVFWKSSDPEAILNMFKNYLTREISAEAAKRFSGYHVCSLKRKIVDIEWDHRISVWEEQSRREAAQTQQNPAEAGSMDSQKSVSCPVGGLLDELSKKTKLRFDLRDRVSTSHLTDYDPTDEDAELILQMLEVIEQEGCAKQEEEPPPNECIAATFAASSPATFKALSVPKGQRQTLHYHFKCLDPSRMNSTEPELAGNNGLPNEFVTTLLEIQKKKENEKRSAAKLLLERAMFTDYETRMKLRVEQKRQNKILPMYLDENLFKSRQLTKAGQKYLNHLLRAQSQLEEHDLFGFTETYPAPPIDPDTIDWDDDENEATKSKRLEKKQRINARKKAAKKRRKAEGASAADPAALAAEQNPLNPMSLKTILNDPQPDDKKEAVEPYDINMKASQPSAQKTSSGASRGDDEKTAPQTSNGLDQSLNDMAQHREKAIAMAQFRDDTFGSLNTPKTNSVHDKEATKKTPSGTVLDAAKKTPATVFGEAAEGGDWVSDDNEWTVVAKKPAKDANESFTVKTTPIAEDNGAKIVIGKDMGSIAKQASSTDFAKKAATIAFLKTADTAGPSIPEQSLASVKWKEVKKAGNKFVEKVLGKKTDDAKAPKRPASQESKPPVSILKRPGEGSEVPASEEAVDHSRPVVSKESMQAPAIAGQGQPDALAGNEQASLGAEDSGKDGQKQLFNTRQPRAARREAWARGQKEAQVRRKAQGRKEQGREEKTETVVQDLQQDTGTKDVQSPAQIQDDIINTEPEPGNPMDSSRPEHDLGADVASAIVNEELADRRQSVVTTATATTVATGADEDRRLSEISMPTTVGPGSPEPSNRTLSLVERAESERLRPGQTSWCGKTFGVAHEEEEHLNEDYFDPVSSQSIQKNFTSPLTGHVIFGGNLFRFNVDACGANDPGAEQAPTHESGSRSDQETAQAFSTNDTPRDDTETAEEPHRQADTGPAASAENKKPTEHAEEEPAIQAERSSKIQQIAREKTQAATTLRPNNIKSPANTANKVDKEAPPVEPCDDADQLSQLKAIFLAARRSFQLGSENPSTSEEATHEAGHESHTPNKPVSGGENSPTEDAGSTKPRSHINDVVQDRPGIVVESGIKTREEQGCAAQEDVFPVINGSGLMQDRSTAFLVWWTSETLELFEQGPRVVLPEVGIVSSIYAAFHGVPVALVQFAQCSEAVAAIDSESYYLPPNLVIERASKDTIANALMSDKPLFYPFYPLHVLPDESPETQEDASSTVVQPDPVLPYLLLDDKSRGRPLFNRDWTRRWRRTQSASEERPSLDNFLDGKYDEYVDTHLDRAPPRSSIAYNLSYVAHRRVNRAAGLEPPLWLMFEEDWAPKPEGYAVFASASADVDPLKYWAIGGPPRRLPRSNAPNNKGMKPLPSTIELLPPPLESLKGYDIETRSRSTKVNDMLGYVYKQVCKSRERRQVSCFESEEMGPHILNSRYYHTQSIALLLRRPAPRAGLIAAGSQPKHLSPLNSRICCSCASSLEDCPASKVLDGELSSDGTDSDGENGDGDDESS